MLHLQEHLIVDGVVGFRTVQLDDSSSSGLTDVQMLRQLEVEGAGESLQHFFKRHPRKNFFFPPKIRLELSRLDFEPSSLATAVRREKIDFGYPNQSCVRATSYKNSDKIFAGKKIYLW